MTCDLPDAAFGFFHDFVVTKTHYVLLESPSEHARAHCTAQLPVGGPAAAGQQRLAAQQPACNPAYHPQPLPSPGSSAAVSLDLAKMGSKYLWGKACIAECIQYDGARKRTKVHLIPRPTSRADAAAAAAGRRVFETDPFFSFHHANAFEDAASGRVVIDTVANHDGIDFSANFETVGGWVGG